MVASAQGPGADGGLPELATIDDSLGNSAASGSESAPVELVSLRRSVAKLNAQTHGDDVPMRRSRANVAPTAGSYWGSYAASEVRLGDNRVLADALGFISLWEDESTLLFADVRGQFDDLDNREGNWGLGLRSIVEDDLILGGYGFYDYRWSNTGNTFDQVTVGLELKSYVWDFRVNGYIATEGSKLVSSQGGPLGFGGDAYAVFQNNTIRVISGGGVIVEEYERGYYGFDAEVGALLSAWGDNNAFELRSYAGGYHFEAGAAGFPNASGPRTRLELTAFDLPWFGLGSRLMVGAEYTWDQIRDDRVSGLLAVQVPLNFFQPRQRLNPFSRRMLDRVRRDVDVVTDTANETVVTPIVNEAALYADTNQPVGTVSLIDATTANPHTVVQNAGPGSTVIADGSKGTISTPHTIAMQQGQTLRGAGFEVRGAETGRTAIFGARPTIEHTALLGPVVELDEYNTVRDLNLVGGMFGIATSFCGCDDLVGSTITGNHVSGALVAGYLFGDIDSHSLVANNVAHDNGLGFVFESVHGTVTGNTATENYAGGFLFLDVAHGGSMTYNTASGNGGCGFTFFEVNGDFSHNIASGNDCNGFTFFEVGTHGTMSNNIASGNTDSGFAFFTVNGTFSGNQAIGNGYTGFDFVDVGHTGTFTGNLAQGNQDVGFYFYDVHGNFTGNTAEGNSGAGFDFYDVKATGLFTGNVATLNGGPGFYFENVHGLFGINSATGNSGHGFDFYEVHDGVMTNNTASDNGGTGFLFNDITHSGTFTNNQSNSNTGHGYDGHNSGGTVINNTGGNNTGGGNTFP